MGASVSTIQLLAIAQAVYRTNGNQFLRESKEDKVANGVLVKAQLDPGSQHKIEVLPEDSEQAQLIIDYFAHRLMMSKLSNRPLGDFIEKIAGLTAIETVKSKNVGILAWAPKVAADLLKADEQHQEFMYIAGSSRYLGKPGDKIELDFNTITKRWTTTYNCYRYSGHDGKGNLVGFLSKTDFPEKVRIKARIKVIQEGRLTQGRTTYVNFAKEVK